MRYSEFIQRRVEIAYYQCQGRVDEEALQDAIAENVFLSIQSIPKLNRYVGERSREYICLIEAAIHEIEKKHQ